MIDAKGLVKRFGTVVAVDGVDLRTDAHGIVGFLGPNGAGKTTTMRILTGFLPMSEGTAIVCGHDVFEDPLAVKARVGYLPETPPLYPELTVGEYLSFVAEIRLIPRSSRLARVGTAMERTGLRGWERAPIVSLSKGYRQRVGLAQAIVHEPPLLVLDEPTSGLDPAQIVDVRALIRELAKDRVVLVSTHVLSEVEALCDRAVIVAKGRVVADGTLDAVAAASGAGPWVELVVRGDSTGLEGVLARIPQATEVERLSVGDLSRFRLRGSPGVSEAAASTATARGLVIERLQHHRASLEDAFLKLVA